MRAIAIEVAIDKCFTNFIIEYFRSINIDEEISKMVAYKNNK